MSDGHFNRAFLPHGDFASGVRTGRALERAICLDVFSGVMDEINPPLSQETKTKLMIDFKQRVLEREKS